MGAVVQEDGMEQQATGQYLSFSLGGEEYGVDILKVREIKGWEPVRPLPDTPPYIRGVMDLRGLVVPIIDLRSRFGLERADCTATTVIIVLASRIGERQVIAGVVVDSVSDVLDLDSSAIRSAPDLGAEIDVGYIHGMVTLPERMVVLLDVEALLDPATLAMEVAEGRARQ